MSSGIGVLYFYLFIKIFLKDLLLHSFILNKKKTESEVSWILYLRKICTALSLFLKIIPFHSSSSFISADAQDNKSAEVFFLVISQQLLSTLLTSKEWLRQSLT